MPATICKAALWSFWVRLHNRIGRPGALPLAYPVHFL